MKYIIYPILFFLLLSANTFGMDYKKIGGIVEKNVQQNTIIYQQAISKIKPVSQPLRVWIHARKEEQRSFCNRLLAKLETMKPGGLPIENKPLQVVTAGPDTSQLRFFKTIDRKNAEELYSFLKEDIPSLEFKDFSPEYSKATWIKPGHIELWLSERVQ